MNDSTIKQKGKSKNLAGETSPYLLQHADNPVHWYPWGPKAFERALAEDKPVFLSIGYSTCHWCHVMARESFENDEVARLMNDTFISVKVDREERPDIDKVYMAAAHLMTGTGGWPATIIMTPDRKPFFAATYIPRESAMGHMGMLELIPKIRTIWMTRRQELEETASRVIVTLEEPQREDEGYPRRSAIDTAYRQLVEAFDDEQGGFGDAPRFPVPHRLLFLLRYWYRTGEEGALKMVEKTLTKMYEGGIYDHLGFGFHRYSTDGQWLVPHFEKMLYDQAMLSMAYLEAYQATGNESYATVVREILTYVSRDMASPAGAFYSAEDADTEGMEGRFYLWTKEDIINSLTEANAALAEEIFNIRAEKLDIKETDERAIINRKKGLSEISSNTGIPVEELQERTAELRTALLRTRNRRVRPLRDEKVLADWNGLMMAAFALAGRVLKDDGYTLMAEKAFAFIERNMTERNGRLHHSYLNGMSSVTAMIDDYSFIIWGLIELYETSLNIDYLQRALRYNETLIEHFWDSRRGGFYFTPDDGEELIFRQKDIFDGAIPSGNAIALWNIVRMALMTGNQKFHELSRSAFRAFSREIELSPLTSLGALSALDLAFGPSREVVIVGKRDWPSTKAMIDRIQGAYLPHTVFLFRPAGKETHGISALAPFTEEMVALKDRATSYVCTGGSCKTPTTVPDEMMELIEKK